MQLQTMPSAVVISREIEGKLKLYVDILLHWQKKINLISNNTIDDVWQRHIIDSLQLASFISDKNRKIVDIGSGAGLPGMVLAIAGYSGVHLVESDRKKALFLSEVKRQLNVDVEIYNDRVEGIEVDEVDVIIARACAPLNKIMGLSHRLILENTIGIFLKGEGFEKEMNEFTKSYKADILAYPSVTNDKSAILNISNITRK